MKLRHHVRRISSESAALPHNLPPRRSIWLLAFLGAGMGPLVLLAFGSFTSAITNHQGELPVAEAVFNWLQGLAALSVLGVQAFALGGLAARRDWGRGMATLACLLWCFWVVGIPVAAVILFLLYRWQYNDTSREADAPHWVRWGYGLGVALLLGWVGFTAWIRATVMSTTTGHIDLLPILVIATSFIAGPIFFLQGAALYGLVTRRHWGREAATAASLVWAFTIVGLPFAYYSIRALWPRARAVPEAAPAPA